MWDSGLYAILNAVTEDKCILQGVGVLHHNRIPHPGGEVHSAHPPLFVVFIALNDSDVFWIRHAPNIGRLFEEGEPDCPPL